MGVFGEVLTAMITPFNEDLSVNYNEAVRLAKHLAENGSDGLVITGTTGESPTLTTEEKIKLYKTIKDAVGNTIKIIAGTGTYSTKESVELTIEAENVGVDGIMLVTPYYNKPTQDNLYNHFKEVASKTELPIMVYNVPGRTGTNILPETIERLSRIENMVAVKNAVSDLDHFSQIVEMTRGRMDIYSGEDNLTLPALAIGAVGIVSVASHLVGREIKEMITAFKSGDIKRAETIHHRIYPIFKGCFIISNPIPVKTAMGMLGFDVGGFRPPLYEITDEYILDKIKSMLSER